MGWVRTLVIWVGIVVGAGCAIGAWLGGNAVVRPSPAPSATGVLQGLSAVDAGHLRDFYAAMADIVVRDGTLSQPSCRTVFELRNKHAQALALAFSKTAMVGKYPGLGERLDAYLLKAIGDLDVPLTEELRQRASRAFAAIK